MNSRSMMRAEAKKIYKKQVKSVPKRQRMPFSDFWKQYKKMSATKDELDTGTTKEEDFNFEDMINANEVTDTEDFNFEDMISNMQELSVEEK